MGHVTTGWFSFPESEKQCFNLRDSGHLMELLTHIFLNALNPRNQTQDARWKAKCKRLLVLEGLPWQPYNADQEIRGVLETETHTDAPAREGDLEYWGKARQRGKFLGSCITELNWAWPHFNFMKMPELGIATDMQAIQTHANPFGKRISYYVIAIGWHFKVTENIFSSPDCFHCTSYIQPHQERLPRASS